MCCIIMMWCIKLNQIIKTQMKKNLLKIQKKIGRTLKKMILCAFFGALILSIISFHIMHT
jgi:hypothetical protein